MIIKHYKMLLEAYKSIYPKSSQLNWLKLEISPEDLKSINQDLLDYGLIETTKQIKNFFNYTVKKNNKRVF